MTTFSATDAAFAGFRLMHERPKVILAWGVFFFITSLVTSAVVIASGAGSAVSALQALQASGSSDPSQTLAAMSALGPLALLLPTLSLVTYSVILAAATRAYVKPQDGAFGAFRFGADELRVAGLLTLMFLVWVAYLFVVVFAAALLFAAGQAAGPPLAALIDVVAIIGMLAALAYPWVRLSLALPMTVDQGRVVLFESWGLTRGHFWRLLGTYLLTAVLLLVVFLLSAMVMAGILGAVGFAMGMDLQSFANLAEPRLESFGGYFSPTVMLAVVLNSLMSAALMALWAGPPAEAYRALMKTPAASAF